MNHMIKNIITKDGKMLSYLNTLVAVNDTHSYRAAAVLLGISQPAVSQHMKAIEEQLQAPVVQSTGKKRQLTQLGRELAGLAKLQLAQLQTGVLAAYNRHQEGAQMLRVGARPEILQYILPRLKFTGFYVCQNLSAADAVAKLQSAELDLAISHVRPDSDEIFAKKALVSFPMFVVHRSLWRGVQELSAEKLRSLPLITYKLANDPVEELLARLQINSAKIKRRAACEDWSVLKSLVEDKMGYAVVPSYVADGMSKNILQIDVSGFGMKAFTYYYLYRREYKNQIANWVGSSLAHS
jgi:DNA-binding transcriptional LysR family regulator